MLYPLPKPLPGLELLVFLFPETMDKPRNLYLTHSLIMRLVTSSQVACNIFCQLNKSLHSSTLLAGKRKIPYHRPSPPSINSHHPHPSQILLFSSYLPSCSDPDQEVGSEQAASSIAPRGEEACRVSCGALGGAIFVGFCFCYYFGFSSGLGFRPGLGGKMGVW